VALGVAVGGESLAASTPTAAAGEGRDGAANDSLDCTTEAAAAAASPRNTWRRVNEQNRHIFRSLL
jgi:hypothetical protein